MRRRHIFKDVIIAGCGRIEIKKGKDGLWNMHIHCLCDAIRHYSRSEIKEFERAWDKITGDSYIVKIQDKTSDAGAVDECIKYVCSFKDVLEMAPAELREFSSAIYDRNLFVRFGQINSRHNMFKFKYQAIVDALARRDELAKIEACKCPRCGGTDDIIYMDFMMDGHNTMINDMVMRQ